MRPLALLTLLSACAPTEDGGVHRLVAAQPDAAMLQADARVGPGPDARPPPPPLDAALDGPPPVDAQVLIDAPPGAPPAVAVRIAPLDIWAQPLRAGELEVLDEAGDPQAPLADGAYRFEAGLYRIRLTAEHHWPLEVRLSVGSEARIEDARVEREGDRGGVSVLRNETSLNLYLGLRHRWFAATGRPPRAGSQARLLMDGEESWNAVHQAIQDATDSIHIATWWWQSDFELIRPLEFLEPEARRQNTMMALLEASPATKRVLVFQNALFSLLNIDDPLEAHGAANDDFEFMGQSNPTVGDFWWEIDAFHFAERVARAQGLRLGSFDVEGELQPEVPARRVDLELSPAGIEPSLGSYHQKFMVADGREAFVGGMNVKSTDWDTNEHLHFEARRMVFGSSAEARRAVAAEEEDPDKGPRKDYMIGLRGPVVQDVEETFATRWRHLREEGAPNWDRSSDFAIARGSAERPDGVTAQLVNTMPEPFAEYAIVESHLNAARTAVDYILVEDQYWRAPEFVDAVMLRMTEVDTLRLIVVTKPISEWTDPGCYWTHEGHARLRRAFPDRYRTYQLRTFADYESWGFDERAGAFTNMDVHSKLMVVDDVFLSVGSCNKNSRGYTYEGETNVNVVDRAWSEAARERVVANYFGEEIEALPVDWIGRFEELALHNEAVYDRWDAEGFDLDLDGAPLPAAFAPIGFAYPLDFAEPSDCLIEPIGQDIARPWQAP